MNDTRGLLLSLVGAQLRSEAEIVISDIQLLNILIAFCDRNIQHDVVADRLIAEFGTLSAIISASPSRLAQVAGMTDRLTSFLKFLFFFKTRSIRSGMPSRIRVPDAKSVQDYLTVRIRDIAVEELHTLFLDDNCHLLNSDMLSRGTTDHVIAYPREIAKRAMQVGASRLLLAHNHPSRRAAPSAADIAFTAEVVKVCQPLGIVVEDHIIVAGDSYTSLRELGLIGPALTIT